MSIFQTFKVNISPLSPENGLDWRYFKWVSDCCLKPNDQFSYVIASTSYIQCNDVRFILDQTNSWILIVLA